MPLAEVKEEVKPMAKKVKSLLFDDGYESFAVNDDPTRIIRFNRRTPKSSTVCWMYRDTLRITVPRRGLN